jgi:hypothetical protein
MPQLTVCQAEHEDAHTFDGEYVGDWVDQDWDARPDDAVAGLFMTPAYEARLALGILSGR